MVIIVPFIFFTAYIIITDKIEMFKDIAAVWGAWVGSVIGYFFGARQVEGLTQRINEVLSDLRASVQSYDAELEDAIRDGDELHDDYESAVDDIQLLVTKYCQNLGQDMQERLKSDYGIII
jgi:hypothetical protein